MAVTDAWVAEQWRARRIAPLKFADFHWLMDARAALYCVDQDALVVSDLHFEKGSYLRQQGNPIPALDTRHTLARLDALLAEYRPTTLVCLGDSFHDRHSMQRMTARDRLQLQTMIAQVPEWIWVVGNHDPDIKGMTGRVVTHVRWQRLELHHEPQVTASPLIFGHFHPKHRLWRKPIKLQGRCFVLAEERLVMPAFGQYTGGLSIDDPALTTWIPIARRQAWLLQQERIYALA